MVLPSALAPACSRAMASACGRPPGAVQPRPAISPDGMTTIAPTGGFGQACPSPRRASTTACAMCSSSLMGMRWESGLIFVSGGWIGIGIVVLAFGPGKLAEQRLEILGLAEVLIDGGEAHIGHVVEALQRFHHQMTDGLGANVALAHTLETAHDAADHALDPLRIHGPLAQRDLHGAHQLVAVERSAATAALDHRQLAQLHPFECGEAAAAIGTDAAAPDRGVILARARILHLRVAAAAIGAPHGPPPSPCSPSGRRLTRRSDDARRARWRAASHSLRRSHCPRRHWRRDRRALRGSYYRPTGTRRRRSRAWCRRASRDGCPR